MEDINAAGVAAAAPWDTTEPVAAVSRSDAEAVPVTVAEKVAVAPVSVVVNTNALDTLSHDTVNGGDVNAA
jgi:hypothetical protein